MTHCVLLSDTWKQINGESLEDKRLIIDSVTFTVTTYLEMQMANNK